MAIAGSVREIVIKYLYPNDTRKHTTADFLSKIAEQNPDVRKFIANVGVVYLEKCSNWTRIMIEMALLFDVLARNDSAFLESNKAIKHALAYKLERMGFPKGNIQPLEYSLEVVGINIGHMSYPEILKRLLH
jgi:hypothetical protein